MWFSASIVAGVAFSSIVYWVEPIFAWPLGSVRFSVVIAFVTSLGARP